VLLFFGASWDMNSARLETETFRDPRVASAMAPFVAVKVDTTEESPASERVMTEHAVDGVPTLLVLDRNGHEVDRIVGLVTVDTIVKRLAVLDVSRM
jgi:thiol:disulfide interchange protein DsbD